MVHRWTRGRDIVALLWLLRQMLDRSGSMERFFLEGYDPAAIGHRRALDSFSCRALALDLRAAYGAASASRGGVRYFFPRPSAGSACKRLNLFLRWMVRRDAVDLGVWTSVSPAKLIVPLDTHVIRLGRCLRLTRYTSPGWRMAPEITASLRAIDPDDPVRFDFSLCHVGMMNACGFGRRQGDAQCPLKGMCRPRARASARVGAIVVAIAAFVVAAAGFAAGWLIGGRRTVLTSPSPARDAVAFVTKDAARLASVRRCMSDRTCGRPIDRDAER